MFEKIYSSYMFCILYNKSKIKPCLSFDPNENLKSSMYTHPLYVQLIYIHTEAESKQFLLCYALRFLYIRTIISSFRYRMFGTIHTSPGGI